MILAAGNDSCFLVDGIPYQRGHLIPFLNSTDGTCSFRFASAYRSEAEGFGTLGYADYTDASTGNPFASFNDLLTWCTAYAFAGIISAGGSSGLTFSKVFYIVAAPAAEDEKAAGATFQDDWLIDKTVTLMVINNVNYTGANITHDDVTGTIGPTAGAFVENDVVVIFTA